MKYILVFLCLSAGGIISAGQQMPRGPYQKSCSNCKVENNVLTCRCNDPRGGYKRTSLKLPEPVKDINNCWGTLKYGDCWEGLPDGPYRQSCYDCQLGAVPAFGQDTLWCYCRTKQGAYKSAYLFKALSSHDTINNCNGQLRFGSCT